MASRQPKPGPVSAACNRTLPRSAHLALGIVLVAVTLAAHFPAVHAGYIWDDDYLFYQNPLIHSPAGLHKFWFSTEAPDYWPLTATTFWLEWRLWGNNPRPYHVGNMLLHALAAVLLWRVLRRLNLGEAGAYLAGLIFAVHPVTVESVAWIVERKTILSMALYLLAILAYLRFEDRGRRQWYVLALLAAAGALLAKTSVVMLPVILLLLIWWRQGTVTRRALHRTIPFFLLSLVLGLVTLWFQTHKGIGADVVRPEGLGSRIASVGWVVWFYLYKIVVPINLAMTYPRWDVDGGQVLSYVPLALLIACFGVLWSYRKSWGRGPLAALGSFVIVLTPVLGLLQMSYARFSLVADHLQYPGLPGVIALIAGGLGAAWSQARREGRRAVAAGIAAAAGAIVPALGALTWHQAQFYRDEKTLWTHTIAVNDRAWAAYNNRNVASEGKGDLAGELRDYTKAIELKSDFADAYNNRGQVYYQMGDFARAVQDITRSIELRPGYASAYYNRGNTYAALGDRDRAVQDYTKAIELKSDYAQAYCNRGNTYAALGDPARALQDFTKAVELKPDYAEAFNNRSQAYVQAGDLDRAIQDLTRAIELKPDNALAYCNRGNAYVAKGDFTRAMQDYAKAVELKSDYAEAYNGRGQAYAGKGDFNRAIQDFNRAVELKPDYADAYYNRGGANRNLRNYEPAIRDFTRTVELKSNYAAAYYNRGNTYVSMGDYDRAVQDYTRAIKLKADYTEAYHNRAIAYYSMKEYEKAWADVRACRRMGGTPNADFLAKLAKATGRTE